MLTTRAVAAWSWLHKWSSLVCTAFMLLLCMTGLPLIFHDEIGRLSGDEVQAPPMRADAPKASLDAVLAAARARYPDRVVQFASQLEDSPNLWFVTLTPTPAPTEDFKSIAVDARTAEVLGEPGADKGFMHLMLKLHVDLFAGLPGKLLLGAMGLLLLVALVSGAVLYAPFMRKLRFGAIRRDRSPRVRWLDLHNLLGIVTLVWLFVVGATGAINTCADLLVKLWQDEHLAAFAATKAREAPVFAAPVPQQRALDAALAHAPGMSVRFVAFPGTTFSTPRHITFFMRGDEPLTSRLYRPVLTDASTGDVAAAPPLPWYLTAMLLSQPLHFGDYGGVPMKVLWTLLDVISIIVLGSGLYLWFQRGSLRSRSDDIELVEVERRIT